MSSAALRPAVDQIIVSLLRNGIRLPRNGPCWGTSTATCRARSACKPEESTRSSPAADSSCRREECRPVCARQQTPPSIAKYFLPCLSHRMDWLPSGVRQPNPDLALYVICQVPAQRCHPTRCPKDRGGRPCLELRTATPPHGAGGFLPNSRTPSRLLGRPTSPVCFPIPSDSFHPSNHGENSGRLWGDSGWSLGTS